MSRRALNNNKEEEEDDNNNKSRNTWTKFFLQVATARRQTLIWCPK